MKYFESELKVRFDETDEMGIVHHKNYFSWFEVARFELLKAVKLEYSYLKELAVGVVVINAQCNYKLSAKFNDTIIIQLYLQIIKKTCLAFTYFVRRKVDYALLADGYTEHAFLIKKRLAMRIPPDIDEKIRAFMNEYGWDTLQEKDNDKIIAKPRYEHFSKNTNSKSKSVNAN